MIINILLISKKGAKRPPARLSGLPLPLTMTVLCTSYHAGVRKLRSLIFSYGEEKEKLIWKNGNSGGEGGLNEIPVSRGMFFSPPFTNVNHSGLHLFSPSVDSNSRHSNQNPSALTNCTTVTCLNFHDI
jgi:hypothetical protein